MSSEDQNASRVTQITVITSDQVTLKIDRDVAERSILIKNLIDDIGEENLEPIPIPNVRGCLFFCLCVLWANRRSIGQ
jgi:S-phase kinase-associated protein 1